VIDPRLIDDLARRLGGSLPESLRSLREDLEQNFKATLQSVLGRLDLVTRQEFDLRTEMLEKARARLAEVEKRLETLERERSGSTPGDGAGVKPSRS
jgi:BMFP domain-containing protein YqiC